MRALSPKGGEKSLRLSWFICDKFFSQLLWLVVLPDSSECSRRKIATTAEALLSAVFVVQHLDGSGRGGCARERLGRSWYDVGGRYRRPSCDCPLSAMLNLMYTVLPLVSRVEGSDVSHPKPHRVSPEHCSYACVFSVSFYSNVLILLSGVSRIDVFPWVNLRAHLLGPSCFYIFYPLRIPVPVR